MADLGATGPLFKGAGSTAKLAVESPRNLDGHLGTAKGSSRASPGPALPHVEGFWPCGQGSPTSLITEAWTPWHLMAFTGAAGLMKN